MTPKTTGVVGHSLEELLLRSGMESQWAKIGWSLGSITAHVSAGIFLKCVYVTAVVRWYFDWCLSITWCLVELSWCAEGVLASTSLTPFHKTVFEHLLNDKSN